MADSRSPSLEKRNARVSSTSGQFQAGGQQHHKRDGLERRHVEPMRAASRRYRSRIMDQTASICVLLLPGIYIVQPAL